MIRTIKDGETERVFRGEVSKRFPREIQKRALRKLRMIDQSRRLEDLRVPPGNNLEALAGDRVGEHNIRVNDKWRICFVWKDGDAYEVEINNHYGR